jgi:hypothetical protein
MKDKSNAKQTVTLTGVGVGLREFSIEHAENLLNLGLKNPPKTWDLTDNSFDFVNGKLIIRRNTKEDKLP